MSSAKGYLWSFIFLLTAAIYGSIPTYLIITYWPWLNALEFNGEPMYTLTLFLLFLWIISDIITLIYFVAMIRAILQRKSEDMGISKGIKLYGLISSILVIIFMIVWYFIFGQIAFFSMTRPPLP